MQGQDQIMAPGPQDASGWGFTFAMAILLLFVMRGAFAMKEDFAQLFRWTRGVCGGAGKTTTRPKMKDAAVGPSSPSVATVAPSQVVTTRTGTCFHHPACSILRGRSGLESLGPCGHCAMKFSDM